jgi:hypothetical protein
MSKWARQRVAFEVEPVELDRQPEAVCYAARLA